VAIAGAPLNDLAPAAARERGVGQHVGCGGLQQVGGVTEAAGPQLLDHAAELGPGVLGALLGNDRADQRGDHRLGVPWDLDQQVVHEMGAAPLPARAIEHTGDGVDQALVGVADDQPDPDRPRATRPRRNPVQLAPSSAAPSSRKDLAVPCSVDPGADQCGGVDHPTLLPDLDAQGVQPHEHIGAGVQRPVAPGRDQLIELAADSGDLGLGQAGDVHGLGDVLHRGWRRPRHSTGPRPRPGPARPAGGAPETRAGSCPLGPGDLQVDRADPSVPIPGPVAVAVGGPLRGALAVLGADLGAHLRVHQRLGEHPHALAQEVDIGAVGLAQQLQQIHGGHGHRDSPLDVLIRPFTSRTYAVATLISEPGGLLLHQPLGR
jgi:hypothetical protein